MRTERVSVLQEIADEGLIDDGNGLSGAIVTRSRHATHQEWDTHGLEETRPNGQHVYFNRLVAPTFDLDVRRPQAVVQKHPG